MSRMHPVWRSRLLEQDGTIYEDEWESAVAGTNGSAFFAGFTEGSWMTTIKGDADFAALLLDAAGTMLWRYQVSAFCFIA